MKLDEILDIIKSTDNKDTKLYLVTRLLKPGISKRSKIRDKYLFKVYQVDCNQELRESLYDATIRQIEKTINKNYEMVDYDILTDETEHLFTYSIQNKVFSFSDVVTNQLNKVSEKVTSIAELCSNDEELWAYCLEFYMCDSNKKIFTFRKILPSKIGVDEKPKSFVKAIFNTKSQQLSLLKEETVNLDEQIDCIFVDETFYVVKKTYFEQIVGLQEEYKVMASGIVDSMMKSGILNGGEKLQDLIETKPSIHKKLIKVEKIGSYKELTPKMLTSMKKVCKRYGDSLKIDDGKLTIEDEKDIDIVLKALGDYYKIGEISGKPYGTFAGKELRTQK
jgi:hypothetical protein